jgi:predicted amidohydrolase
VTDSQPQPEAFSVALAQIATRPGQPRFNLERHLDAVRQASQAGASLVLFPELSLSGYLLNHGVREAALTPDAPLLAPLLEASRDIAMVVGVPLCEPRGGISNAALLLEGGEVRGVHRKLYLPTYGMFDEGRFFVAGEELRPLHSALGTFGVLICEDAWHLSSSVFLSHPSVDAFLIVAGGPSEVDAGEVPAGARRWHWLVGATAITSVTPVYFANRCGWEEGVMFGGGSWAVDGRGKSLTDPAPAYEEVVLVAPFSRQASAHTRGLVPIPPMERFDLWRDALERGDA